MLILTALITSGAFASEFDETMKLAQEGDAASQLNLGAFYESGDGVVQDFDKAFSWYAKAAKQGDAVAAWKLGDFYSKGLERAIANHGSVSVIGSVVNKVGLSNIVRANPFDILLTAGTAAMVLSERAFCSSSDPDHYVDAYKWYQIATYGDPETELIVDSKELSLLSGSDTSRNETVAILQLITKLPNLLKGQKGRSEEEVVRITRNKLKKLTSVLSEEQKGEAKELAGICVNSDYQDCAIGDYNATDNQPHSFQTTLYDKSTKWKVSACTQGGKLKGKYLSADSGYIDQSFSEKGILDGEVVRLNKDDGYIRQSFSKKGYLVNEISLEDGDWQRQSFHENGLLSEQTTGTKLTDEYIVTLISRSKYDKSGRLKYKVNYSAEHSVKQTRNGGSYTEQYKTSQEFYSKGGQLTRKTFYKKKGNKPLYTNYYKADGTLKRSKNADGSRRSIKKSK